MLKTNIINALSVEPKNLESNVLYLTLDEIRRDGGTQPRAAIDLKHVKLLSEQIEDGKDLEAVIVFYDGESYWLADGFHRWHAHRNSCCDAIACVIHQGSRRDAVLYSVGANADHKPALPRSREDKRRAITTLLQDPEWGEWSDREIAIRCKVDHKTVGKIRTLLTGEFPSEKSRVYKTKHGSVASMNTANIGKISQSAQLHSSDKDAENSSRSNLSWGDRVTVTHDHPLFPNSSGMIAQMPNPNTAIVELDTGSLELISLVHLKPVVTHHLKFEIGSLVEIRAPGDKKIDGRYGCIASTGEHSANVWLRDINTITMYERTVKYQQLTPLPLYVQPDLKQVRDRLNKLKECNLDPFELEILNLLERPVAFTLTELEYLAIIEKRYENLISNS